MLTRTIFLAGLIVLTACGGDSGPSDGGDGGGGGGGGGGDTSKLQICAHRTDKLDQICGDRDGQGGWSTQPPNTCLGPATTCAAEEPIFFTLRIEANRVTPLTASLVFCDVNPRLDNGASCVPARESAGIPLSGTLTWEAPNGNTGPTTTLRYQQTGTSAVAPPNCSSDTWSNATDILIVTGPGDKVIVPFIETLDTRGCAP
jgi:hypothetical protein